MLTIITENKCHFPIPNITGTLRIGKGDDDGTVELNFDDCRASLISSTLVSTKK
jgi:hypothetical protein